MSAGVVVAAVSAAFGSRPPQPARLVSGDLPLTSSGSALTNLYLSSFSVPA